jgi:hypothetical protein
MALDALLERNNPEISWELKRDFDLVFKKVDEFFDKERVSMMYGLLLVLIDRHIPQS